MHMWFDTQLDQKILDGIYHLSWWAGARETSQRDEEKR